MKNSKLLAAIAKLLKVEESALTADLEKDGGDEAIVKAFSEKHTSYTLDELNKLLDNSNKAYFEKAIEKADFDINAVPRALYSKIKASAFESLEKEVAKKVGIEKYEGLSDLIDKALEKVKKPGEPSKDNEELQAQIATLKGTVLKLEGEVKDKDALFVTSEIGREFNAALKSLNLDYDPEVLVKQEDLVKGAFQNGFKIEKKGDKLIVVDKDGKPKLDKLGEPVPVSAVLKEFATDYGFKFKAEDPGGRGAGDTKPKGSLKGRPFNEVAAERKVEPNSPDSDKLFKEWKAENPS